MGADITIAVTFDLEKETKGALRYAERVADGAHPKIGTIYISKTAFAEQDYPQAIKVTVEPAGP